MGVKKKKLLTILFGNPRVKYNGITLKKQEHVCTNISHQTVCIWLTVVIRA